MNVQKKATAEQLAEWRADLEQTFPPGSTVYTVLRHVSDSGMSRWIDVVAAPGDRDPLQRLAALAADPRRDVENLGSELLEIRRDLIRTAEPRWMSYRVAAVCGLDFDNRRDCIKIGGVGMDMGFAIAYDLSRELYRDSFECIGPGCPSNDHTNGDRDYTPHRHSDGGYALRHRWI